MPMTAGTQEDAADCFTSTVPFNSRIIPRNLPSVWAVWANSEAEKTIANAAKNIFFIVNLQLKKFHPEAFPKFQFLEKLP
jgi:hypothetical protein